MIARVWVFKLQSYDLNALHRVVNNNSANHTRSWSSHIRDRECLHHPPAFHSHMTPFKYINGKTWLWYWRHIGTSDLSVISRRIRSSGCIQSGAKIPECLIRCIFKCESDFCAILYNTAARGAVSSHGLEVNHDTCPEFWRACKQILQKCWYILALSYLPICTRKKLKNGDSSLLGLYSVSTGR